MYEIFILLLKLKRPKFWVFHPGIFVDGTPNTNPNPVSHKKLDVGCACVAQSAQVMITGFGDQAQRQSDSALGMEPA